jgi:hypothetical protein
MADATLTVTVENNPFMDGTEPFKIILDWMSADDGSVSKAICATYAAQETARTACPVVPKKIRGGLLSAEFIPGALGVLATDPPTNLYDTTILDAYGLDILGGAGGDESGSVASRVDPPVTSLAVDSELTLTIAAAGDNKKGRIILNFAAWDRTD